MELGYEIPARVGQTLDEICTPALIVDLDAFERNVAKMKAYCAHNNIRLRAQVQSGHIGRVRVRLEHAQARRLSGTILGRRAHALSVLGNSVN